MQASLQDEFYRAASKTLPGIGLSSECQVGNGQIDFFLPGPGWGIELLRDGDRMEDHYRRFQPNGAYHPSIRGSIKDWVILDCRHSHPKRPVMPLHFKLDEIFG